MVMQDKFFLLSEVFFYFEKVLSPNSLYELGPKSLFKNSDNITYT